MWSKISSALKRPETPVLDTERDDGLKPPSVLSTVFNQHPNLSNFHEPSEVPFPTPSPPASPSKNGRRGIFKRTPKTYSENEQGPQGSQLSLKLSIPHLNKVTSSIAPNSASESLPFSSSWSRWHCWLVSLAFVAHGNPSGMPSCSCHLGHRRAHSCLHMMSAALHSCLYQDTQEPNTSLLAETCTVFGPLSSALPLHVMRLPGRRASHALWHADSCRALLSRVLPFLAFYHHPPHSLTIRC